MENEGERRSRQEYAVGGEGCEEVSVVLKGEITQTSVSLNEGKGDEK